MSFELIGLMTVMAGVICAMLGHRATVAMLIFTTLFGSAGALIIGAANIQPAHLFLGFLAVAALTRTRILEATLTALAPPRPGFWFACLVLYGVVGGYLLPRIFAGTTMIVPLGMSEYADTGSTVPLGPVSSNFTQSVYLSASLATFAMVVAIASTRDGFQAVLAGLLAYCAGNVFFALLDLATYFSGTGALLDFMRNARYVMHHEEEVGGLKRIVGSFTEASAFARSTLGALGFAGTLWLSGYKPMLTGSLALASLALVILSTSSAGLAGVIPVLIILYVTAFNRCGVGPGTRRSSLTVLVAPPLLALVLMVVAIDPEASAVVREYVDTVILNKATTSSGMERASWNMTALQNFMDTWGIGVGLGTARASSFPLALLSNVGVLGTLFYILFAATAFMKRRGTPRTLPFDVRLAARNACLGLLIGDLLVGPVIDQGLFFYALAAIASAEPERVDENVSRTRPAFVRSVRA